MEAYMWIIWLSIFVIALIIEAFTNEIVSIWFSLGAMIATIISLIGGIDWYIELIIFIVISAASLLCLRPVVNKLLKRDEVQTNVDEIIGKKGIMQKSADALNYGEVKIAGIVWTAIVQNDNDVIEKGDKVKVLAISGNKLIVTKVKE